VKSFVFFFCACFLFWSDMVFAQCPGCCSGHGGISNSCGVGGKILCVDGTTSPSCLCSTCGVSSPTPTPTPTPLTYSATASPSGIGDGRVTSTKGHDCSKSGGNCTVTGLTASTIVTFSASAATGSIFTGWTGDCSGSQTTCTVTIVSSSKSVGAIFGLEPRPTPATYSATLSVSGVGDGRVVSSSGHDCASTGGKCTVTGLNASTNIAFTANSAIGSVFGSWSGDCSGTQTVCNLTIGNSGKVVGATFIKALQPVVPLPSVTGTLVEYKNTADFPGDPGGHYFYSATPAEQQFVDSGGAGRWTRTGKSFKTGGTTALCRFYGSVSPGPNSHFFTISAAECQALKNAQMNPIPKDAQQWNYEGTSFEASPYGLTGLIAACPNGTVAVYRAYNSAYSSTGQKNKWDSNHRFSLIRGDISELVALGWKDEGVVFCVPQ
jgi:uncharacterized repeat protein (TIGR02543 family)